MANLPFDTPTVHFNPFQVLPFFNQELQLREPVNLVANTVYPAGSLLGEVTGSPGTFGLTITLANVALTSNVVTATSKAPHGLSVGNTVAVTAVTATSVNGTGLTVLSVPTPTTFTYAKTASDVTSAADTGTVVRDAGTSVPKCVLSIALATDTNGRISQGGQADFLDGSDSASPFFTGVFVTSQIGNLDTVSLAAMTGAKILVGTLANGLVKIA